MEKKKENQLLDKDRDYPFLELTEGPISLFHKNYAPILNRECHLSAVVFTVLVTYVNREDGKDKGKAYPGIKTIQAYFGGRGERGRGYISEDQITRCTRHLEKRGFLTERKRGRPGQSMRYCGRMPSRMTFLNTFGVDLESVKSAKNIESVFDENLKYLIDNIPESRRQKILNWLFDSDRVYKYCTTEPYLNRVLEPDLNNVIEPYLNRDKNIKDKKVKEINRNEKDSSIYSDSVTDNLHSSSKKTYSNRNNKNPLTDNGFPAATACIFGEPKGNWDGLIHGEVQRLASKFQETLIAEGFAEPDYFEKSKKWWRNNYKLGKEMITSDFRLAGDESPVDYWIGMLDGLIYYYHHRDPNDKEKRDSYFDFVPKIRNIEPLITHLPGVLAKRRKVEEMRGKTEEVEEIKEEIKRKARKWKEECESRPSTTKLANEQKRKSKNF